MRNSLLAAVAVVGLAGATPALAQNNYLFANPIFGVQTLTLNGVIVLQAVDTGWIANYGSHSQANNNYIVGDCAVGCGTGGSFNDYFHFDLSGVQDEVVSAVLSVGNGVAGYEAGPLSTWSLFDFNGAISSLDVTRPPGDLDGIALFNDLQSGVLYGSRGITNVAPNSQVDVTLNASALAALNRAAGGQFVIGGTLLPGDGGIPEPATWALMLAGFGLAGASLRQRRRALA